jgi:hypothetical protein
MRTVVEDTASDADDDDGDYVAPAELLNDDNLSTSYVNEDDLSEEENTVDEDQPRTYVLYEEHKKAFYQVYTPLYESAKFSTHLITDAKYDWIVGVFRTEPQKKDTMNMCKARHVYMLQGNVESCYLCRDGKTVATFERIFDVLLQVHQKLGHARDVIKNKDTNWRRITLE